MQPYTISCNSEAKFMRADLEHVHVTAHMVIAFVAIATAFMFFLYFVLNKYIFLMMVGIFAYGSCVASAEAVAEIIGLYYPRVAMKKAQLPWVGPVAYKYLAGACFGVTLVTVWLCNRCAASLVFLTVQVSQAAQACMLAVIVRSPWMWPQTLYRVSNWAPRKRSSDRFLTERGCVLVQARALGVRTSKRARNVLHGAGTAQHPAAKHCGCNAPTGTPVRL